MTNQIRENTRIMANSLANVNTERPLEQSTSAMVDLTAESPQAIEENMDSEDDLKTKMEELDRKLKTETAEKEKLKKELVTLNKKLSDKQNEVLKIKQMKKRNEILEEENRIRKRPENNTAENINEAS